MSRKRKKKPGSDRPADQQPEIVEQQAAAAEETSEQLSEKKSQKPEARSAKKAPAKGQDLDAKPQIHPIEEKWRNMDDRMWFRAACWITALAAFLRYFMLLLR